MSLRQSLVAFHFLGLIFIIISVAMFMPVVISLIFEEPQLSADLPFIITALILMAIAVPLVRWVKPGDLDFRAVQVLTAINWLLIPLIGCIPYFTILGMPFEDAYFESMAGFTGTGFSMISQIESVPKSLQLWRSLTMWLGGVGVILMFLSVFMEGGSVTVRLYRSEARTDRITPTIIGTVRRIWWIYISFTAVGTLLLYAVGMPLFDAVNHAMTSLATGGFSIRNNSIAAYDNPLIEVVVMFLMFLGAISFATHYYALKGRIKNFYRNSEVVFMVMLMLVASVLIMVDLSLKGLFSWSDSVRYASFQVVSAITTSGFNNMDITRLDDFSRMVIIALMIVGGSYGSTAGALKLIRSVIIIKSLAWYLKRMFLPRGAVTPILIDDEPVEDEQITDAFRFALLYLLVVFVGILAMTAMGYDLPRVFFDIISAQGNVGLSVGLVSPDLSSAAKFVFIMEMWAGRLEIIPVLVIFLYLSRTIRRQ